MQIATLYKNTNNIVRLQCIAMMARCLQFTHAAAYIIVSYLFTLIKYKLFGNACSISEIGICENESL